MQIKEAKIFGFGKFRDKTVQFEPGINIIYGANETGKSTLHAFLLAMLFGMDKSRGRASATDGYQRYEPWRAPAYYSGALRFVVDGRPFYLERNFYHREKRDFLRNEADGEELSVAYGDLAMLLGGMQKETFGNTYDIPQSGAATGKELADSLAEYLTDTAESGDAGFRVTRAVSMLREKKRQLSIELKHLQEEKEQQERVLKIEQELLQKDCVKLREDIKAAGNMTDIDAVEATEKLEPPTRKQSFVKLRFALVIGICATALGLYGSIRREIETFESAPLILTIVLCLLLLALVWTVFAQRKELRAEQQITDAQPPRQSRGEQMFALLGETLDEKETRLYNISEQLESLQKTGREAELEMEIDAAQFAADEIEHLAKEFCEEAGDALNSEVSRYVSAITAGKYDSVRVDENGKLWVVVDGKEIPPSALSRGTLEQFYLALRLAAGRMVTREEAMPIFLDDVFTFYDDDRLRQTLKVLSGMNTQILLFTCQKREAELLSELGVNYQLINL